MKNILSSSLLLAAATLATAQQDRCDAPYPEVYCNTTSILKFNSEDCTPFHVFIARGSDEPYPGRLGNLTSEICSGIGGEKKCTYEDVEYPAKSTAWGADEWCKSAGKGAKAGQQQMKDYSKKCPDAKLILVGFSQGAAVTQDMLGGGGGPVFECEQDENEALDPKTAPGKNVVAAVTFGAVVRSRDQNFTVGPTQDFDGQASRTESQLTGLQAYSSVLLDYCHFGDPMCAVGSEPADVGAHLDYFLEHNTEVKEWVVGMAKASSGDVSTPKKPGSNGAVHGNGTVVPARPAATASATLSPVPAASKTPADGSEAEGAASALSGSVGVVVLAAVVVVGLL